MISLALTALMLAGADDPPRLIPEDAPTPEGEKGELGAAKADEARALRYRVDQAREDVPSAGWFGVPSGLMASGAVMAISGVLSGLSARELRCTGIYCLNIPMYDFNYALGSGGTTAIAVGVTAMVAGALLMTVFGLLRRQAIRTADELERQLWRLIFL